MKKKKIKDTTKIKRATGLKKWYIYQKERFPIATYGLYVFSICFAAICYGNIIMDLPKIDIPKLLAVFAVVFLQFLMIRIADEFKDYDEDKKYRPYRPVPRGLVTLKEDRKSVV